MRIQAVDKGAPAPPHTHTHTRTRTRTHTHTPPPSHTWWTEEQNKSQDLQWLQWQCRTLTYAQSHTKQHTVLQAWWKMHVLPFSNRHACTQTSGTHTHANVQTHSHADRQTHISVYFMTHSHACERMCRHETITQWQITKNTAGK